MKIEFQMAFYFKLTVITVPKIFKLGGKWRSIVVIEINIIETEHLRLLRPILDNIKILFGKCFSPFIDKKFGSISRLSVWSSL